MLPFMLTHTADVSIPRGNASLRLALGLDGLDSRSGMLFCHPPTFHFPSRRIQSVTKTTPISHCLFLGLSEEYIQPRRGHP